MKILFDSQIYDWQINGGISRYFTEVIQRLEKNKGAEVLFEIKHSYNNYIRDTRWLIKKPFIKNIHFTGKLGAFKIVNEKLNRSYSNRLLKKGIPDVFHPTYYNPYFLEYIGSRPFVLTVHDLINEQFPDGSRLTKKVTGWKEKLVNRAARIIAVSENTKRDIINYYKISPDKITTIYHASPFDDDTINSNRAELEGPPVLSNYILFVGNRNGYKNFKNFITEVQPVVNFQNLKIVLAGGGSLKSGEISFLKQLNIYSRVIALSHISDDYLISLYKSALIFIFPSLYEGFGIPVIEAMQCRCPALISNTSALPEVGGSAAAYFDPYKEGDLHDRLDRLINDEDERNKMKVKGVEQVKRFNWDNTAKAHFELYKSVIQ